jgi:hypothetical protein
LKRAFTQKLTLILALVHFIFHTARPAPILNAYSAESPQSSSLEDLWIDMRIGEPLIPLFNQMARSDDIARVDHPSQVGQLAEIENGRKLVIFKSIAEAEEILPDIAAEIDIIGYNLEQGQTTPEVEKADPVGSIQKMRQLADEYGLKLAFGPDHDFALSHGVEIAPFVDIFVLQIQRQQTNQLTVENFVLPLVPELRAANPDLQISVQVRTEGNTGEIIDLLAELEPQLDGISILTSPDTVAVAEELIMGLRPYVTPSTEGAGGLLIYIVLGIVGLLLAAGFYILRRRKVGS